MNWSQKLVLVLWALFTAVIGWLVSDAVRIGSKANAWSIVVVWMTGVCVGTVLFFVFSPKKPVR